MIAIVLINILYSSYVASLLGNLLWKSAIGVNSFACVITSVILSSLSVISYALHFFNIVNIPLLKYLLYGVSLMALIMHSICTTFFGALPYFYASIELPDYCNRTYGVDAAATVWLDQYNELSTRTDALTYIYVRTILPRFGFTLLLSAWLVILFYVMVVDIYISDENHRLPDVVEPPKQMADGDQEGKPLIAEQKNDENMDQ